MFSSLQVEDLLELALLALGKIQEAFLQQNPHSESSVTLTSSIAALMLSRLTEEGGLGKLLFSVF
jgi:hypothetical protein